MMIEHWLHGDPDSQKQRCTWTWPNSFLEARQAAGCPRWEDMCWAVPLSEPPPPHRKTEQQLLNPLTVWELLQVFYLCRVCATVCRFRPTLLCLVLCPHRGIQRVAVIMEAFTQLVPMTRWRLMPLFPQKPAVADVFTLHSRAESFSHFHVQFVLYFNLFMCTHVSTPFWPRFCGVSDWGENSHLECFRAAEKLQARRCRLGNTLHVSDGPEIK